MEKKEQLQATVAYLQTEYQTASEKYKALKGMYQECVALYRETKELLLQATETVESKEARIVELETMVGSLNAVLSEVKSQL